MIFTPRLFVIVGTPGSGKDLLIRAVNDLGALHADIVPKHTSRSRRVDDGDEMVCPGDPGHNLEDCDIQYENYGDRYGLKSQEIWKGLRSSRFQVAVVSDLGAMRDLHRLFHELMVLVYAHSEKTADQYRDEESKYGDVIYVERRAEEYEQAWNLYLENFLAFNHVLIHAGLDEDFYDQIFRLFRAYERGDLSHTTARSVASERIWDICDEKDLSLLKPRIIQ